MSAADDQFVRMKQYFTVTDIGCWEWIGSTNGVGYGEFFYNGELQYAHRASYQMHKGPIPDGLVLDHLCRNTRCINPDHVEAVTQRENILRGMAPSAVNARKTHCHRGHELAGDNLRPCGLRKGWRSCKKCHSIDESERGRRQRAAKRAAQAAGEAA